MASDGQPARRKNVQFFFRMFCILLSEAAAGGVLLWIALKTGSLFL